MAQYRFWRVKGDETDRAVVRRSVVSAIATDWPTMLGYAFDPKTSCHGAWRRVHTRKVRRCCLPFGAIFACGCRDKSSRIRWLLTALPPISISEFGYSW